MPKQVSPPVAKEAVAVRQERQKELIAEQLEKVPIIHHACEKVGISRASYYRWRKEDREFAKTCDDAIAKGVLLVNDMAESQLLSAIRDGNMTGVIFWLKSRHPAFRTRLEVTPKTQDDETLTPEQEEIIRNALRLASISLPKPDNESDKSN